MPDSPLVSSAPAARHGEIAGCASVTLQAGELEVTFLPSLGMVGCSILHRGEELLAQRDGVDAYAARGSTFGLPLLYPWANRLGAWEYDVAGHHVDLSTVPEVHRDGATGLPSHGLTPAGRPWQVIGASATEAEAQLQASLDWAADGPLQQAFPFPHRAHYTARLRANELSVQLMVEPLGETAVPISFGFHPYLTLPGSQRQHWRIELPVRRRMLLDDQGIPSGGFEDLVPGALSGALGDRAFDDSFDRLAAGPGPYPRFAVADARRRLEVEFRSGFAVAQVYAPDGSPFIAFEPMTAPVDALRSGTGLRLLSAGSRFEAEFTITVTRA